FGEAPQAGYVGKTPAAPGELDPDLARAFGIDDDDAALLPSSSEEGAARSPFPSEDTSGVGSPGRGGTASPGGAAAWSQAKPAERGARQRALIALGESGVAATTKALEKLLREGRPEFSAQDGSNKIWVPHRPPRPDKSEGGKTFVITSSFDPK